MVLEVQHDRTTSPNRSVRLAWQLQADALITLDRDLARAVKELVRVEPIEALF